MKTMMRNTAQKQNKEAGDLEVENQERNVQLGDDLKQETVHQYKQG
eukprot:CAMPEP_0197837958 /NCGR_PEP_ID=MMETSP1437-20131217/33933_1 /TAXON_ID=49252 ORGANISM="Eucampia antarctica, Strain CCMP1452" /NCGR_SAMPLE_ID=MMETSP1437 /ASSEMBLY_ACC=CAM_ASM_001096 /LENGTH=45 /DNA_ID= /DNA_START= /DNA_END= /DNA_ORIENTATION=